ncbi:winged helix-turn-helix domain-containing protein [[Eubacterium] cellulosolvens]
MATSEIHPKAYLVTKRNVKAGLRARSKILFVLEEGNKFAPDISKHSGLGYDCVIYHLRSMRKERLVERSRQRPYLWALTKFGQQRLSP